MPYDQNPIVNLAGRIVRDPSKGTTKNGRDVVKIDLAYDGLDGKPIFVNGSAFNEDDFPTLLSLRKGAFIVLRGPLTINQGTDVTFYNLMVWDAFLPEKITADNR